MTEQVIRAIEAALNAGYRVQLKKERDGTVKVQTVVLKTLKSNTAPTAQ